MPVPAKLPVRITGTTEAQRQAETAVKDLCSKGYSSIIAGPDFEVGSPPPGHPSMIDSAARLVL